MRESTFTLVYWGFIPSFPTKGQLDWHMLSFKMMTGIQMQLNWEWTDTASYNLCLWPYDSIPNLYIARKNIRVSTKIIPKIKSNLPKHPLFSPNKNTSRIMMNVGNPETAFAFGQLPNEGIGLARLEFAFWWNVWYSRGDFAQKILPKNRGKQQFTSLLLGRHRSDFEVSKIATPAAFGNEHSLCEFPAHFTTGSINCVMFFLGGRWRSLPGKHPWKVASQLVNYLDVKPTW